MNVQEYRETEGEQSRTADLLRLLPKNRESVLDIGARDGHFSRLFRQHFRRVVALDLSCPPWDIPGVETVAGDVTDLQFDDNSFDCVFCAEVLEHIPALPKACSELARVARHEVVVGVPYRQDTRVGQMTCRGCGKVTPPWGHINTFDDRKLQALFSGLVVEERSYVGSDRSCTTGLAAALMTMGGNPWGPYDQEEGCIYCGATLVPPPEPRPLSQRLMSAMAHRLNALQERFTEPHGNWIHIRFAKPTHS